MIISQALLSPLETITSFVINAFSRKNEFEADKFALDLSTKENAYAENLKFALAKLGSENKSVTDVDPLYSAYHHSHPVSTPSYLQDDIVTNADLMIVDRSQTMPERITRLDELIAAKSKEE